MRSILLAMLAILPLAACGQPAEAPTPSEVVSAAPPATDAVESAPAVLTAGELRRVCRAGLAAIHGQTVEAIQIDGVVGQVITASWRAPVDGGRRRAECRVEADLISWKPLDRPDPAEVRWMNRSDDPVVRYTLDGDVITVTQTLPDGASEQSRLTVADQGTGQ